MSPPTNSNNPPRFSEELNDSQFEDLCRDLLSREPGIKNCIRYGLRGQKQHGIDLLAENEQGGKTVAQCKCYKDFGEKDLKRAAGDFLNAINHWKEWGIIRFILIVGCSVRDSKIQVEKEGHRKKYAEVGIDFELWGDDRIAEKLRFHPDLVETHIGPAWIRKLCGAAFPTEMVSRAVREAVARGPVGDVLIECVESERSEVDQKFADIREMARSGKLRTAFNQIEAYRHSPRWALLDQRAQGRGLRLAASLHLDHAQDVDQARQLLIEARKLAPDEHYQTIESSIAYRVHGRAAALEVVTHPQDLDAWNMRQALLIEEGKFELALEEILSPPFSPNANSWRIASIAALCLKNIAVAKEHSDRALEEAPNWFVIRFHAAKMDYFSALLPHFPMLMHIDWPIPPKHSYLLCDSSSLEKLDRAERIFSELLGLMDEDDEERVLVEAWRLGCIANHPARRHEAAQYARKLLESNPAHLPAAVWALERGFDIDAETVSSALSHHDQGPFGPDDLQAACVLFAQTMPASEALTFLDAKRADFEAANALFFWRLVKAQVAEDAGDSVMAAQLTSEEPLDENRLQIQLAVLKIRSNRTDNSGPLCQELMSAFERDGSPRNLYAVFDALVQADRGKEAIRWTEELVRLFPTPGGLSLALQANYDAHQYPKCLELLEKNRTCFAEQHLPARLVHLEIECLRQTGHISEANALAGQLVKREESTSSLITLFQTQVTLADFKGCVMTVRALIQRTDVTTAGLLQMAAAIQVEDIGLAKDCWRAATKRGIEDAAEAAAVMDLAFRLGLDDEASPLMPIFFAMAESSGGLVQARTFDQVIEIMREQAEGQRHATKVFNEAQVPSHMLGVSINAPMAVILIENMRIAAASGRLYQHFPALIRPGTKSKLRNSVSLGTGELYMDITALYIAEEIGILSIIEKLCAPVFVSSHILELLQAEIHRVTPHQPSLHQPNVDVLQLVEDGVLKAFEADRSQEVDFRYADEMGEDWASIFSTVRSSGGVLCDFTPPRSLKNMPFVMNGNDATHIVSCGDMVKALQSAGELSEDEATEAYRKLGEAGMLFQSRNDIKPGNLVVLDMGIAEQLAGAKALEPLTRLFEVKIAQRALEHIRSDVGSHRSQMSLARRLKETAERLRRGILEGTYKTLSKPTNLENDEESERAKIFHRSLLDLLGAGDAGIQTVWVDDRFLMRFEHVGSARTAGVSDILKTLWKQEVLTSSQYFDHVLGLRIRNARYLPLETEEIWMHIQMAQVVEDRVRETKGLSTLRRYLAACFSDFGRLCPPFKNEGGVDTGEFPWVLDALKAIAEAIARLWEAENMPANEKVAKADWLLNNLYAPYHGVIEAVSREPVNGNKLSGYSTSILWMFTYGYALQNPWNRKSSDRNHPRAQFYSWIAKRLINPSRQTEPEIVHALAREIRSSFLETKKFKSRKIDLQTVKGWGLRLFFDLPQALQQAMKVDTELCKVLDLSPPRTSWKVIVCERKFCALSFWRALARASKGQTAEVTSDTEQKFAIGPPDEKKDRHRWVSFSGPDIPEGYHVCDARLRLLYGSKIDHKKFLASRPDWIDRRLENRNILIEQIVELTDPGKRMEFLCDAQEASAAFNYRNLRHRSRRKHSISIRECVPPSPEMLCAHLRIDLAELVAKGALDHACTRLVADIGIAEAIERMSALPVLFSDSIVINVSQLKDGEFRILIARLMRKLRSPIAKLHLFHLVAVRSHVDEAWLSQAQKLRDELFSEDEMRQRWKAFRQILGWTKSQVQWIDSYRDLPGSTKLLLAWFHAGRLFDTLSLSGADAEYLANVFTDRPLTSSRLLEAHESDFYFDVMHPRFAHRMPCLLRGFGAILYSLPLQLSEKLKLDHIPRSDGEDGTGSSLTMLLRDHSILLNHHESFLGGDARELLLQGIRTEAVEKFMPINPSRLITTSISVLEETGNSIQAWGGLIWALANSPGPDPIAARLNVLLERVIDEKIFADEDYMVILTFASDRSHCGFSAPFRQKIETEIWKKVDFFRMSKCSDDEKKRQSLTFVLGCFASLSIATDDKRATHQNFHRYLAAVARAWPEMASKMINASAWPAALPIADQTGYWEAAMAIRTARDSVH